VEGVLGGKVVEDGGLVGAGGIGDLLDGDSGEPSLGEEIRSGGDDGITPGGAARTLTNQW
jgi:hypothetical protein